jgi:hypothetical protein
MDFSWTGGDLVASLVPPRKGGAAMVDQERFRAWWPLIG